jgi:glucose-6-phosphate dehydrogenase assembly protein OpcA
VVEAGNLKLVVHDLAWSRSWQFRLAVAALFDEPVALAALPAIRSVRLVHHPRYRASALMLLAWLSIQSGWRFSRELALADERRDGAKQSFAFESPGGTPVEVVVEADPASAPLGLLELSAPQVAIRVSREAGSPHLVRELDCQLSGCHASPAPADPDDDAGLVGTQLARGGKNSLFCKVFPRFLELLGD